MAKGLFRKARCRCDGRAGGRREIVRKLAWRHPWVLRQTQLLLRKDGFVRIGDLVDIQDDHIRFKGRKPDVFNMFRWPSSTLS